jgi:hypothetical protein
MKRARAAAAVAAGVGILSLASVALFAVGRHTPGPAMGAVLPGPGVGVETEVPADTLIAYGRVVYDREGCTPCHGTPGEGSPRFPLDGVGARLDSSELRLWVVDPQAISPGVRKPSYDHLPDPDVTALVAYLASLR